MAEHHGGYRVVVTNKPLDKGGLKLYQMSGYSTEAEARKAATTQAKGNPQGRSCYYQPHINPHADHDRLYAIANAYADLGATNIAHTIHSFADTNGGDIRHLAAQVRKLSVELVRTKLERAEELAQSLEELAGVTMDHLPMAIMQNPSDHAAIVAAIHAIGSTATEIDRDDHQVPRENGVYDPGVLKAIFLAGGPGSGKSYASSELFGVPKGGSLVLASATGLKLVNSDPFFEHFLRAEGVDPKDLATMPHARFTALTEGPKSPRASAKRVREGFLRVWLEGRLGLILDGTGDDYAKIHAQSEKLRALGYDTFMVFVNTSLEVAKQRNRMRARSLPDHLVEEIWNAVQQNLGAFQSYFGGQKMIILDATSGGPIPAQIQSVARRIVSQPVENYIGKQWMQREMGKKAQRNPAGNDYQSISRKLVSLASANGLHLTEQEALNEIHYDTLDDSAPPPVHTTKWRALEPLWLGLMVGAAKAKGGAYRGTMLGGEFRQTSQVLHRWMTSPVEDTPVFGGGSYEHSLTEPAHRLLTRGEIRLGAPKTW